MHVAVVCRPLHGGSGQAELDHVQIRDIKAFQAFDRRIECVCNVLRSQRARHTIKDAFRSAEYINGQPEWPGILGPDLADDIADTRHRPTRSVVSRNACIGSFSSSTWFRQNS